jgi:hypothetical protein
LRLINKCHGAVPKKFDANYLYVVSTNTSFSKCFAILIILRARCTILALGHDKLPPDLAVAGLSEGAIAQPAHPDIEGIAPRASAQLRSTWLVLE